METTSLRQVLRTLFVLTCLTLVAQSQSFKKTSYYSPNGPGDLFVADLNHDSRPDLVVTQRTSNMVTVFLNRGHGSFASGGSATYLTGGAVGKVVVADFNGDGHPDIATANYNTIRPSGAGNTGSISILFGRPDGTFENHVDYPVPSTTPVALGVVRVGKDALPSLVAAFAGDVRLLIMRNDGTGKFTEQDISLPAKITDIRGASAADYNRDGFQDLAAAVYRSDIDNSEVLIYDGNATGGFSAEPRIVDTTNAKLFAVNTVDLNSDRVADLLLPFNSVGMAGVFALANTGSGNFTLAGWLKVDPRYTDVGSTAAEGDFNSDGFHEILVPVTSADHSTDAIALFPGASTSSWGAPVYLQAGILPEAVATGDFNGDGLLDFAVTVPGENKLVVFLNTTRSGVCSQPRSSRCRKAPPTHDDQAE